MTQPEISHFLNGHFNYFTADKLFDFLRRLDQTVTSYIRPHRLGGPYQEVSFAAQSVPNPKKKTPSEEV